MKLFLARHGQTGEQYKNRYVGSTDVPISESGFVQVGQLAERLSSHSISLCYCSPLLRCRQTAEVLKGQINCDIVIEHGLAEVDFGRWELATFAEICERDPDKVDQWSTNVLDFTFPDGENSQNFYNRVLSQVEMIAGCGEDSVLVVSHGGVIRAMICILLGLSFENYILFNVKPATFVELDVFGESAVLSGLNL